VGRGRLFNDHQANLSGDRACLSRVRLFPWRRSIAQIRQRLVPCRQPQVTSSGIVEGCVAFGRLTMAPCPSAKLLRRKIAQVAVWAICQSMSSLRRSNAAHAAAFRTVSNGQDREASLRCGMSRVVDPRLGNSPIRKGAAHAQTHIPGVAGRDITVRVRLFLLRPKRLPWMRRPGRPCLCAVGSNATRQPRHVAATAAAERLPHYSGVPGLTA
jgi:hypothetical protein